MRRGLLLLGLGAILLALSAAPGRTAHGADDPHAGAKPHDSSSETEREIQGMAKEESDIFKGFLDLAIWTIVVFVVLLLVLGKFAWKPMMEGLANREKNIHNELEQAQKANADAQAIKADFERQISQANQQARNLIEEARTNAKAMTEDMVNQAKAEIQAERDRLRRELDTARDQAQMELWQRSTQLASLVSSKAIRRQLTIEDQHRLVDEALNDLGVAANDRQRVLASVQ